MQRQLAIEQKALEKLLQSQADIEQQQNITAEQLASLINEKSVNVESVEEHQVKLNEIENTISLNAQAQQQQQQQQHKLTEELAALCKREVAAKQKLLEFQEQLTQRFDETEHNVDGFSEQQTLLQQSIEAIQDRSQTLHQSRHQMSLVVEQLKSQRLQREQSIRSNQENVNLLTQRLTSNSKVFTDNSQPIQQFEQQLPQLSLIHI